MSQIRFYHLTRSTPGVALPQLLDKAIKGGRRVVVRVTNQNEAEKIAADLWTFNPDSFLPHGTKTDGFAEHQPIWITPGNDVPNRAKVVMTLNGATADDATIFDLVCDVFDGRDDDAIAAARERWKSFKEFGKDSGHTLTYWQQTESGWDNKAA
jgi:DNA polymerase III subunit chi